MSNAPNGERPAPYVATGEVPAKPSSAPSEFSMLAFGAASPHGNARSSSPRAAYSHSSSVGKRFDTHAQNECASFQSTQFAGCVGFVSASLQSDERVASPTPDALH